MQRHQEFVRGDFLPKAVGSFSVTPNETGPYIAYPKALRRLEERLGATPEELAAWIFMGPEKGGIAAYRNANELNPPPRFYFAHYMGEDYLGPMMGCWFLAEDVHHFSPVDRYMTGQALIERWSAQAGIVPKAFIQAKIEESRLIDLHPTYGGTRGTISEDDTFPPLEAGLFVLAHVEGIELEDFGLDEEPVGQASNSCQAVPAARIRSCFAVMRDEDANDEWWKDKMRDAKRNGLAECRVGRGKPGPGGSLWRPELVAAWLVDRDTKSIQGLGPSAVRHMLKRFSGCAEAAETLFPPDE